MSKKLDWSDWFYGLVGGFIGGGSGAVIASLTVMGITPQSYNLGTQLGPTLKLFFACFILNGVVSIFMWLKQKPLPEFVEKETVTITKTHKITETPNEDKTTTSIDTTKSSNTP